MSRSSAVRPFEPDEWLSYRDLRLRALAESPDAFASTLAAEQARTDASWAERVAACSRSPNDLLLIAESAGEPIGLAWGRIEPTERGNAHLYQMWVAPSHRSRGAGRMLLEAVIAWVKERRAHRLTLSVTRTNTAAVRLYARAGFEPVGPPGPVRPGSPLLAQPMQLDLAAAGARPGSQPTNGRA